MSIVFIDLDAQQQRIKPQIDTRIQAVLAHGNYIMGPEVRELEEGLEAFCGAKHALTCANGTDALHLALLAIGAKSGDAVFCPSFTFAATAEIVPHVGATPVFVDVEIDSFNMSVESLKRAIKHARSLGLRPAGVIPVDLFGQAADYNPIEAIARENGMWIIADSAQGFGAKYHGKTTGSIGDIATTSFFPAKPLGCYGDGGALFTSNDELAASIGSLRVHGKGTDKYDNVRIGVNSRLDTLQAAILLEKLAIYPGEIRLRQTIAERYTQALQETFFVPRVNDGCSSVWAQYTLRAKSSEHRLAAMERLKLAKIPSVVYYPLPLHQQTAYAQFPSDPAGLPISAQHSQTVFSLPMHPYLTPHDQALIIDTLTSDNL